jgi:hypothetical protein
MDPVMVWTVILLICGVAFWLARRFAMRLNGAQRKLMLYMVLIVGLFVIAAMDKDRHFAFIVVGLLAMLASFFAVMTAPDKS